MSARKRRKKVEQANRNAPYQEPLDMRARESEEEGIRQGLDDVRSGRTRPVEEFFAEFEKKYLLSR